MIPSTLNSDTHVNQIEIQNEVKTTQTKSSVKGTTTNDVTIPAKNREIHKKENAREQEHENNEEVINKVMNVDRTVRNVQEHVTSAAVINMSRMTVDTDTRKEKIVYGLPGSQQRTIKLPDYWVQFNVGGGNRISDGGMPMYYEPDRNLFVRIVFAIVLFMLILTAGFVAFVYMTDVKQLFLQYGTIIMIIGVVGMLGLNYAMMCSACTRTPPCNYVCLFLAVCFMSLIAAFITARYKTQIVLLALLATTATVVVCLCLACTRFDFTKYLLYVVVIAAAFSALVLIVGITMLVTKTRYKPLTLVILVVGTLISVVVLTIELQMILGGRTVELSEDDYALGAFMLYTSIIDIFIKLIQILGILDE